jgi:hypothetical protein
MSEGECCVCMDCLLVGGDCVCVCVCVGVKWIEYIFVNGWNVKCVRVQVA